MKRRKPTWKSVAFLAWFFFGCAAKSVECPPCPRCPLYSLPCYAPSADGKDLVPVPCVPKQGERLSTDCEDIGGGLAICKPIFRMPADGGR